MKYGDIVEGVTDGREARRGHRPFAARSSSSRATADRRPRISIKDPETGETDEAAEHRRSRALLLAGRREHHRAGRRADQRRRSHRQDPARDHQDARTSPAVCPASPSSSRPASRRTTPSSREIDGMVSLRQGHQGQAQGRHHPARSTAACSRSGARVPDPQGQAHPGAAGRPRPRGRAAAWTVRPTRTTSCASRARRSWRPGS